MTQHTPHSVAVQGHPERGHLLIEWFEKAGIEAMPSSKFVCCSSDSPFFSFYVIAGKVWYDSARDIPEWLIRLTFSEWEAMMAEGETVSKEWPSLNTSRWAGSLELLEPKSTPPIKSAEEILKAAQEIVEDWNADKSDRKWYDQISHTEGLINNLKSAIEAYHSQFK